MSAPDFAITGNDMFGRPVAVAISDGRIASVRSAGPSSVPRDLWIFPGLIDIQVNGFGGHDLNAAQPTPDAVAGVTRALWRHGVTRFCPTICTAAHEQMMAALRATARACDEEEWVGRAVAGIHVEGPYISPEDGPRGAHPADHVRAPDWREFEAFQEAAGGRIRVVTLAPERPGALEFIERLSRAGIVPAIGHTAAAREDIRAAVLAGARLSTHLGNGAHATLPRHPNYIWAQLAEDGLWASLIVDGHHLPPDVVKVFTRAKGAGRCLLISDAVWLADQPPGRYHFLGSGVDLTPDGKVRLGSSGYLAGSVLDLAAAVANIVRFAGLGVPDAVAMAARHPARLLGRTDLGALVPGNRADVVLVRWSPGDGALRVVQTVVDGTIVYRGGGDVTESR
ncbi:MAG TPA: amidohydrolase family protein [bacterium]|nr:amidohydrolase family protein [bacterium]